MTPLGQDLVRLRAAEHRIVVHRVVDQRVVHPSASVCGTPRRKTRLGEVVARMPTPPPSVVPATWKTINLDDFQEIDVGSSGHRHRRPIRRDFSKRVMSRVRLVCRARTSRKTLRCGPWRAQSRPRQDPSRFIAPGRTARTANSLPTPWAAWVTTILLVYKERVGAMAAGRLARGNGEPSALNMLRRVTTLGLRVAIAMVFCYAGMAKLRTPTDFADSIAGFQILPTALIDPLALALPVYELGLGVWLVSGWKSRTAAFCGLAVSAVFLLDAGFGLGSWSARGMRLLRRHPVLADAAPASLAGHRARPAAFRRSGSPLLRCAPPKTRTPLQRPMIGCRRGV